MNELRLLLIAAAMMTPMPVSAQAIDDSTTCATIRADLDADQPDRERVKAIFVYVANTLVTIDHLNAAKGGTEIIGRMSGQGRQDTIAMVTVGCSDHPTETVLKSASDVYEGLKAMNAAIENGPDAAGDRK